MSDAPDGGQVLSWDAGNTQLVWIDDGSARGLTAGATLPASPVDDQLFLFSAGAGSQTLTYESDGTTAITVVYRGYMFEYDSNDSKWLQVAGDDLPHPNALPAT